MSNQGKLAHAIAEGLEHPSSDATLYAGPLPGDRLPAAGDYPRDRGMPTEAELRGRGGLSWADVEIIDSV